MKLPILSKEQTCKMFGCTLEQLNSQYLENAKSLEALYLKAQTTGKKVNGYTSEQLKDLTEKFYNLALN